MFNHGNKSQHDCKINNATNSFQQHLLWQIWLTSILYLGENMLHFIYNQCKLKKTSNSRITFYYYCLMMSSLILRILHKKSFKSGRIICHYTGRTQVKCFSELIFIIKHPKVCLENKSQNTYFQNAQQNTKTLFIIWFPLHT